MGLIAKKLLPNATRATWTPSAVRLLRKRVDATQEQFARILGVVASTVHRWESGAVEPDRQATEKLMRLRDIAAMLDRSFRQAGRAEWFMTPEARLGGDRPMDLLALPTGVRKIREYLAALKAGDFV